MGGATKDYQFGQKNQWRRTLWNGILSRTDGREGTQPIIYLAGPQDTDRGIATAKGVPGQNLVAIDRSQSNVRRVRSGKNPALDADVIKVLKSWPSSRPVCGVVLDFCCGLEGSVLLGTQDALLRRPFTGCAVSVNFQRGRDSSTNRLREVFAPIGQSMLTTLSASGKVLNPQLSLDIKNRSVQFMAAYCMKHAHLLDKSLPPKARLNMSFDQLIVFFAHLCSPTFYSYKSGQLVFDSVTYTNMSLEEYGHLGVSFPDADKVVLRDDATARKISAMLAVRTSRMSGVA